MSRLLCAVSLAAFLGSAAPAAAQPGRAEVEPPPLGTGRILGMLGLGGVTGLGGSVPGLYAGIHLELAIVDCDDGSYCGLTGGLLGAYAGYTLAAPFGVYGASDRSGSLGSTFAGGVIGGGLGLLGVAGLALLDVPDDVFAAVGLAVLVGSPPLGALVGFSRSRRAERPPPPPRVGALLMLDVDGFRLGAPVPAIAPSRDGFAMYLPIAGGAL